MAKSNDLQATGPAESPLTWNAGDPPALVQGLLKYVEERAEDSVNWYWKNKRSKSFLSQWIQFLAVVLTSGAALVPIIGQFVNSNTMKNGLMASLLVGVAAALLALDKAFGFSSGWTRYVMTATNIRKSLEEFRMDWAALIAKAGPNPAPDQIQALIERAKEFRITVEGLVLQETKDWVTEFQNSLSQLEKDAAAQLATLKAQSEKAAQVRDAASQPGSIQLTVPNAEKADNATIQIKLEDAGGALADQGVKGTKTWVRLNLSPGQYRLTVSATVGGNPASTTAAVIVKPGEIAQPAIPLPV
jgi:hypothetical protein